MKQLFNDNNEKKVSKESKESKGNSKVIITYIGKLFINGFDNINVVFLDKNNNEYNFFMKKTKKCCYLELQEVNNKYISFYFTSGVQNVDDNEKNFYYFNLTNADEYKKNGIAISYITDLGTLVISELKNKVFLPYTKSEIEYFLKNEENNYLSSVDVVENEFIRSYDSYKHQYSSRYKETYELLTKKEDMTIKEKLDLSSEMCVKKYLHPAIISACKHLNELNVYLDCLDKNELDDFKVFNIKYEITPMISERELNIYKKISLINRIISFFKNLFLKKNDDMEI